MFMSFKQYLAHLINIISFPIRGDRNNGNPVMSEYQILFSKNVPKNLHVLNTQKIKEKKKLLLQY